MVLSVVRRLFHKHRYIGNAIFYTGLLSAADVVSQKIQYGVISEHDFARTGRMATIGFVYFGPALTFIYNNLDKMLPGNASKTIIKKILIDQAFITSLSMVVFYVGMSALERKSWDETIKELKKKYLPTYAASFLVWPTAQAINFALVPTAYRVVYISSVAFFWTVFLSYMKNKSELPYMLKLIEDLTKEKEEILTIEDVKIKLH